MDFLSEEESTKTFFLGSKVVLVKVLAAMAIILKGEFLSCFVYKYVNFCYVMCSNYNPDSWMYCYNRVDFPQYNVSPNLSG